MPIPTEPIGSVPRPAELLQAMQEGATSETIAALTDKAVRETIEAFEETGSPVITDGEQSKPSFATYPVDGLQTLVPDGVVIPFADGHTRQLPCINAGPFRYQRYADTYLIAALKHAHVPVKQAVISASAISLLYPPDGIEDYSREIFLNDVVAEVSTDIRRCLDAGAHAVQIDFTEGRLSIKLDPSKALLGDFIALNNRVLDNFTDEERRRIGVHTCPGGDRDSTHSADIDYAELLPDLFKLKAGNFYIQLASEADKERVLKIIAEHGSAAKRIFIGVIDPIDAKIETPEQVRDRVLQAAEFIPPERLGTTDDCGFSPFADDVSTARETAFAKITARIEGTALAAQKLGI